MAGYQWNCLGWALVTSGVPQDCELIPVMSITYINDIFDGMNNFISNIRMI